MTSHVMDLTWLGQFHIIMHLEVDLFINYLTYLIFQINLSNQPFESTYAINLLIKSVASLACGMLLLQTYVRRKVYSYLLSYIWYRWLNFLQITYLLRREVYHPQTLLGSSIDESLARRSLDFFFVQTLASCSINVRALTKMTKAFW